LGRLLLEELVASAQRAGIRKLIAVIGDSQNHASIGLHTALGFQHVGVLSDCGWKFDRWLDVVLMERAVGPGSSLAAPQSAA
jgi:phosphinothricin acetyltransferase